MPVRSASSAAPGRRSASTPSPTTTIAQVGSIAQIDAPDEIEVIANSLQSLDAQGFSGAGGLVGGIAGSVGVNVLVAVTISSVMPLALFNQQAHNGLLNYSNQRIDVIANSETVVDALAGAGGIGLVAGAGAAANVGLITKTTMALMGAIADAETDVVVTALSEESILSISAAGALALGLTIAGTLAIYIIAPQTVALITPLAVIHAKGNVHVKAYDEHQIVSFSGSLGASLLASVGAAVEITSIVKTTTAAILGASVTADGLVSPDCTPGNGTGYQEDCAFNGQRTFLGAPVYESFRGIVVEAVSRDQVLQLAFADGAGGVASANGVVTATTVVNATTAFIVLSNINGTPSSEPSQLVKVFAWDDTYIVGLPQAASSTLLLAAVGAAVDGGIIVKATQAFIGGAPIPSILTVLIDGLLPSGLTPGVVNSNGDVKVIALSEERIVSLERAGASGGIGVTVAGSVGVYIITVVTRAFIGGLASLTPDSTVVFARGNVLITADEQLNLDIITGGAAYGGTAAVGASPQAAVVTKVTEAYVGTGVTVTALGLRPAATVNDGSFILGIAPDFGDEQQDNPGMNDPGTSGESVIDRIRHFFDSVVGINVRAPGAISASDKNVSDDTNADSNARGASDPALTGQHTATPGATAVRGLAVVATNRDNIAVLAFAGAAGYGAGAAVSGAIVVVTATTIASVGALAQINPANAGADNGQSILVKAANDLFRLGIVGSVGVGGLAGANVGASLTAAIVTTLATMDAMTANALADVLVTARSTQKIITVTVGAAAGGLAGVGGSIAGNVIVSTTLAGIGTIGLATTHVRAGGNVLVSADDESLIVAVVGQIAVGGLAGVGASAALNVVLKTTSAMVGAGANIDALGNNTLLGVLNGGFNGGLFTSPWTKHAGFHGLAVQATSKEDLYLVIITGSAGGLAGLAGAISLTIMNATTLASIGAAAQINQGDQTGAHALQSVTVTAADYAHVFAFAGGLAVAGLAGVSGAIDVGLILNNTIATIGAGAQVRAVRDVDVNALAEKHVQSIGISLSFGGLIGAAGSVSLWAIGAPLLPTFSVNQVNDDGAETTGEAGTAVDTNALGGTSDQALTTVDGLTSGDLASGSNILSILNGNANWSGILAGIGEAASVTTLASEVTSAATAVIDVADADSPIGLIPDLAHRQRPHRCAHRREHRRRRRRHRRRQRPRPREGPAERRPGRRAGRRRRRRASASPSPSSPSVRPPTQRSPEHRSAPGPPERFASRPSTTAPWRASPSRATSASSPSVPRSCSSTTRATRPPSSRTVPRSSRPAPSTSSRTAAATSARASPPSPSASSPPAPPPPSRSSAARPPPTSAPRQIGKTGIVGNLSVSADGHLVAVGAHRRRHRRRRRHHRHARGHHRYADHLRDDAGHRFKVRGNVVVTALSEPDASVTATGRHRRPHRRRRIDRHRQAQPDCHGGPHRRRHRLRRRQHHRHRTPQPQRHRPDRRRRARHRQGRFRWRHRRGRRRLDRRGQGHHQLFPDRYRRRSRRRARSPSRRKPPTTRRRRTSPSRAASIGFGASLAFATANGTTSAHLGAPTVWPGDVNVIADGPDKAVALTVAGAGGILAASGAIPTAKATSTVSATVVRTPSITTLKAAVQPKSDGRIAEHRLTRGHLPPDPDAQGVHLEHRYFQANTEVSALPASGPVLPAGTPSTSCSFSISPATAIRAATTAGTAAPGSSTRPSVPTSSSRRRRRQHARAVRLEPGLFPAGHAFPSVGTALPTSGTFAGEIFLLEQAGGPNLAGYYRWNGTAWQPSQHLDQYIQLTRRGPEHARPVPWNPGSTSRPRQLPAPISTPGSGSSSSSSSSPRCPTVVTTPARQPERPTYYFLTARAPPASTAISRAGGSGSRTPISGSARLAGCSSGPGRRSPRRPCPRRRLCRSAARGRIPRPAERRPSRTSGTAARGSPPASRRGPASRSSAQRPTRPPASSSR